MSRSVVRAVGYAMIALALTECSEPTSPVSIPAEPRAPQLSLTGDLPYPILAGAGDVANCTVGNDNDESTARLLDAIFANGQPGNVMQLGEPDESATPENYPGCYVDTWGRHKAITRPMAGNKDYIDGNLDHYFRYWGAAAGEAPGGYYSFDAGEYWHVVVINSNNTFVPTNTDAAPQVAWLRNDLALNTKPCIAAFMHHPRFFSSTTGGVSTEAGSLRPIWDELYKHGVEFVASGNRHHYERLKPMRADGTVDTELGVIQFISGTGGTSLGLPQPTTGSVHPNSDVRGVDYGVVKFTLKPDGYDWQFVPARNRFNDAGSANCHPPTIPVTLLVSSSVASSAYGEPVTFTAKAEDGSRTVRIGTVSFISGGACDAPAAILASDLTLDPTGRAKTTVSSLDVSGSPYAITACYTGAGSYQSSSGQVGYSVTQAQATVTLGSLFHNYDGQAKSASASTDAAGESAFQFAYQLNGTAVAQPTEPGSYGVVATLINANYQGSASGTLIINAVPVGTSDSYSTDEDGLLTVAAPGVLANDTDADVGQTLQAVLESGSAHGSVTLNPDGSFSYTPVVDYNGTDSFSYRASDGVATSAPATVTIDIKAVDDPPLAVKLDIIPGSSTNTIALGGPQTQTTFAVHSSTSFDATLIDPAKVTIGDEQGAEAPLARNADGTFKFMLVDVSGDGRRDFYAYVNKADLRSNGDLTLTTKSLTVLGGLKAPSAVLFRGTDKVHVVQ